MSKLPLRKTTSLNINDLIHVHDFAFLNNVRNTVTVYDYHNVAAMILLHTGWDAELNFQVSFFNEHSAEIIIGSRCL